MKQVTRADGLEQYNGFDEGRAITIHAGGSEIVSDETAERLEADFPGAFKVKNVRGSNISAERKKAEAAELQALRKEAQGLGFGSIDELDADQLRDAIAKAKNPPTYEDLDLVGLKAEISSRELDVDTADLDEDALRLILTEDDATRA